MGRERRGNQSAAAPERGGAPSISSTIPRPELSLTRGAFSRYGDRTRRRLMNARMSRRRFLGMAAVAGAAAWAARTQGRDERQQLQVMTATGAVAVGTIGLTLPHEHVLVDFVGAAQVRRDRYDAEEVFKTILPHLRRL